MESFRVHIFRVGKENLRHRSRRVVPYYVPGAQPSTCVWVGRVRGVSLRFIGTERRIVYRTGQYNSESKKEKKERKVRRLLLLGALGNERRGCERVHGVQRRTCKKS